MKTSPTARHRWRRPTLRLLLAAALIVTLLPLVLALSLRSAAVRQALLRWAEDRIEDAAGVRATARDFTFEVGRGELTLEGLELAASGSGARPFLTASRARASVRWGSLLGDLTVVERVVIDSPRLDFDAPFPEPADDGQPEEAGGGVEVLEMALVDGVVLGTAPPELELWLDAWRAEGIRLGGSYRDDRLRLALESARLVTTSSRRPATAAVLSADISLEPDGTVRVGSLELLGDHLELRAHGAGMEPLTASLELRAAPAQLFPDLVTGGRLDARGELELAAGSRLTGTLTLGAEELPAELLEPLLSDVELPAELAGTQLDAEAELDMAWSLAEGDSAAAAGSITGHAELRWRRRDETLVSASLRSTDPAGDGTVQIAFEAGLLPQGPGRAVLSGELWAPAWQRFDSAELRASRLDVQASDLAAVGARLGLAPEVFAGWRPAGELAATLAARGPVLHPDLSLDATWSQGGEPLLTITASSRGGAPDPLALTFEARLLPAAAGRRRLTGELRAAGWPGLAAAELRDARLEVEIPDLPEAVVDLRRRWPELFPDQPWPLPEAAGSELLLGGLTLEAAVSGDAVRAVLEAGGTGLVVGGRAAWERLRLEAQTAGLGAGLDLGRLLREAEARLELERPLDGLWDSLEAELRLEDGTLHATLAAAPRGAARRPATVTAMLPLASLAALPGLGEPLAGLPFKGDGGPLMLTAAAVDLEPFLPLLAPDGEQRLEATVDARLALDPADLTALSGAVEVSGVELTGPRVRLDAADTVRLELGNHRVRLLPVRLAATGPGGRTTHLDLSGHLELAPTWRAGAAAEELVANLAAEVVGNLEAELLTPFLEGGVASGNLTVEGNVHGPPESLSGHLRIAGKEAAVFYPTPYATRFEDPEIRLVLSPGEARLETARARLNQGTLSITGGIVPDRGLDLELTLRDIRYRLDHGLTTQLRGDLELHWPPEGGGRLSGEVVLERGVLVRDLHLDREILGLLLAPDLTSPEKSAFDALELDLSVATLDGIWIRNNLADLHADWSPLRVRGTLANPLFSGRIDVDPGGRLTAYGQIVRIDEASLTLPGDPAVAPRLDFETTSSFEDSSLFDEERGFSTGLGANPDLGGLWESTGSQGGDGAPDSQEAVSGLQTYYADRLLGGLGGGGGTKLSVQSLPIFGETNTQARLTATQQLSPNASFIYSVNMREAEGQTYLLDLYGFAPLPGFAAQVFTNDDNNEGLTLRQTLRLGGGKALLADAPRLRRIDLEAPEGLRKRRLSRSLSFKKGNPFPEGSAFDVEIDLLEELRQRGYPGAEVRVDIVPARRDRVDIAAAIDPGPKVSFEFEGDVPSRPSRRAIREHYRTGELLEASSLAAMREEAQRALRAEGYLEPRVEVVSERTTESRTAEVRTIRIQGEGGRRIQPGPPEFPGLPEEDSRLLAADFETRLARVELAAGIPGAERYLERSLAALGYPEARVVSRRLSRDGSELRVEIEPGQRQHLVAVEITGVDAAEAAHLMALLPLGVGSPARADRITRALHTLEDDLRRRGYALARARTLVEPVAEERPMDIALRFEVETGPRYEIAAVRFEGLEGSRAGWAQRVADLEPGTLYEDQQIGSARRRLYQTGVFRRIQATTEEPLAGAADGDGDGGGDATTTVTFQVEERPRYSVAYGVRWESSESLGLVVDAIDHNFLGRGQSLGVRATYADIDDRSLRLYHVLPRVRGSRATLELFLEGKDEIDDASSTDIDGVEAWAQLTFPLGRHTNTRIYSVWSDRTLRDLTGEQPAKRLEVPVLGWQLARDTRDRAIGAQHTGGTFFGLDLSGTHEDLASDLSAFRAFAQLKLFRPLGRAAEAAGGTSATAGERAPWIWAQSFRLGLQETFGTEIPTVDRLRAGGEYSVRGYPTNSLGPRDAEGNALGGEVLLVLNEELHFPVWGPVSGLVFFDAGNVWESVDDIESLFTSLGAGLRASSPAGPLRLDVAIPLDRRDGDPDYKVYLGFGHAF